MSRRKNLSSSPADAGTGSEKVDMVLLTERMIDELLSNTTAYALAKVSGLNYLTLQHIAKGEAKRVSHKVYNAVKAYYDAVKAGTAPARPERGKPGRKPRAAGAVLPSSGLMGATAGDRLDLSAMPYVRLEAIESEIERLEKRIVMLKDLLELAKGL